VAACAAGARAANAAPFRKSLRPTFFFGVGFPMMFCLLRGSIRTSSLSILGTEAEGDTPENHKAHPHGKVNRQRVLDEALLNARIQPLALSGVTKPYDLKAI
jgi:hypothetical protein